MEGYFFWKPHLPVKLKEMKDKNFAQRLTISAQDFVKGVKPILENQLGIEIHPIEEFNCTKLIKNFDQQGIDAFYYDKNGSMRGLASRMNYSTFASRNPAFTFRYKLWDEKKKCWDENREYTRKLHAANAVDEFHFFPKIHIESYSHAKGSGNIGWSFAAKTKDILNFIKENIDNSEIVQMFEPSVGEKRQVITISVEKFAREHVVMEIQNGNGKSGARRIINQ